MTALATKVSICIATYDKPLALRKTLDSIVSQDPEFTWELIVVDDGSPTDETTKVCEDFPKVQYHRIDRAPGYRNPAKARNVAYRMAKGEIIIAQSDDVVHRSPNCITALVNAITPGAFVIATVINTKDGCVYSDPKSGGYGDQLKIYTSPSRQRPLFFLGALYRRDLYAVGGNDEEFEAPSGEDRWFGLCLMNGLGLTPIYSSRILGHHQAHPHCDPALVAPSQELIRRKIVYAQANRSRASWTASGGPWLFV